MEVVMSRGPNFIYAKEFIKQTYGVSVWENVLDGLPNDAAELLKGPMLVTETYPFGDFKAMLKVLSETLGNMAEEETARVYEYIADRSLNSVYKIFFRFANPAFAIKNYPKLWRRFFTTGNVEVVSAEAGHAILKFTLPEIFLDWLPAACYGYSKKAIEMAGGRELQIEKRGQTPLKAELWEIVFELFWKEG
jgi:hypothetical protein